MMKKSVLLYLFLVVSMICFSQFPGYQGLSSSTTLLTINGGTKATFGLTLGDFTDTATANANPYMKGISGLMIRTGNTIWVRNLAASAWIMQASTSYYSFSNLLTESPAGTVKFGGIATGNTTMNMDDRRLGIDSGKVVIMGNSAAKQDSLFAVTQSDGSVIIRVSATENTVFIPVLNAGGGIFLQTGAATNILNGGALAFSSGGFMQGFQSKVRLLRNYPLTSDSVAFLITNDTLSAKNQDSSSYHPLQINFRSTVDNLERVKYYVNGAGKQWFDNTITAAATTGNRTIDKPSGTVNIAAAGTTVTVTNSLCTTASIVYAIVRTGDATAYVKNTVPGNGSFVINLGAAAGAEISVGFLVIN